MSKTLPNLADIERAAQCIHGTAHRTPVVTSRTLDALVGSSLFLKCENLQRAGAFKFRGAFNALSNLSEQQRRAGVLTYSSGNHAQAIALAGRLLGIETTVIMPDNAPASKLAATRGYGAEVIQYDPRATNREELAAHWQAERNMTVIPPYDHADIVSGQGTAALELIEECGDLDFIFTPCGGGGLLSGSAIVAKGRSAKCKVVGVEPELADDASRSFRTGRLQTISNPPTIADGLRTPHLGTLTFALVQKYVDDMVTVSEKEIVDAMRFLWTRTKLVVEPSGAVPVAAVMQARQPAGSRIGIIISGGNVDLETACALFGSPERR